jgi:hypothetical protein
VVIAFTPAAGAALIERHGGRLLNLPCGAEGAFNEQGEPEERAFRTGEGGAGW